MAENLAIVSRPGPVNLRSGNICSEWANFKQKFEIYLIAIQHQEAAPDVKWALLMGEAGDHALAIYNSFKNSLVSDIITEAGLRVHVDNTQNYDAVVAQFDRYAEEKKSLTLCRELFNKRNQKKGEPFGNWLTDLRNLVKPCEYGDMTDSMIKDRIVWGTSSRRVEETLRAKPALSLQEVIDLCKALEVAVPVGGDSDTVVDAVQFAAEPGSGTQSAKARGRGGYRGGRGQRPFRGNPRGRGGNFRGRGAGQKGPPTGNKQYECKKCATWHCFAQCPAFGKKCLSCGQLNHFSRVCQKKASQSTGKSQTRPEKKTDLVESSQVDPQQYILNTWSLEVMEESSVHPVPTAEDDEIQAKPKEWAETLKLGGEFFIRFKLDPGSEVDLLPYEIAEMIRGKLGLKFRKVTALLRGFDNSISVPEGSISLRTEARHGDALNAEFYVSKKARRPILGIESCVNLRLVMRIHHPGSTVAEVRRLPEAGSKDEFIQRNEDVFTGLGNFRQTIKIMVDPLVQPQMCPPRRYNYSIVQRLKPKLDELEKRGVISKITEEIPKFVSNLVIREKGNKDLRICLDPESLNKAIIKPRYTIPTVEDIAVTMKGKKVFSVLDLKDGFWHTRLDEDSSLLCSFSTPYGLYKFLKMPFGVKCAPETFQFLTDQVFQDTGARVYFDDVLIAGVDYEEHDKIMAQVIAKARSENVRFNPDKMQYRQTEVKFLGMIWSLDQIKIDPERIEAIQAIKEPTNRKELQKVLGVFNHVRKFVPQMAELAAPLQDLLSGRVEYLWMPVHAENFRKLKESVTLAPGVTPFDVDKPIVVQADASQYGLGACLIQGNKLVTSASRKLTEAEKNYAQVEKEMLALYYAATKFEKFIYGMPNVLFQTDHKPLVSIFAKPLWKITNNRLKKWRLNFLRYNPKVEYLPGKYMYLADLLSRDYLEHPVEDDPEMLEVVHEVTKNLSLPPEMLADFKKAAALDAGLQAVSGFWQKGWPEDKSEIPKEASPYYQYRNDLFVEDGLVIKEDKIVVPVSLRAKVLQKLHIAHLGVAKTKARARQVVFWPGMDNEITNLCQECRICERNSAANVRESLIPHEVPDLPFQKVGTDIFDFGGNPFLVLVDRYSKWIEVKRLASKSSRSVIEAWREIFATHGIPEIIMGDNNPFNSYECTAYAESIGSSIVTSSPEYPRSNGLAEKAVGIAKQIMLKCSEAKTHYLDGLREYNNTPLAGLTVSPSQILMSRACRTVVPTLRNKLAPKVVEVRGDLQRKQDAEKAHHDKRARRSQAEYKPGENVVIRRNKCGFWEKARVVRKHPSPRSYIVELSNGRQIRRNTFHMKRSRTRPDRHDAPCVAQDPDDLLNRAECFQVPEPRVGEEGDILEPGVQDQPEGPDPDLEEPQDAVQRPRRRHYRRRHRNGGNVAPTSAPRQKRAVKRPWWWTDYYMMTLQMQTY